MTTPEAETQQRRKLKSDRYAVISRRLLQQAQKELNKGDTLQASEKAYGAVAGAVKSYGELRGWNHYGHFRVGRILDQLRDEWNDPSLTVAYSAVETLHNNFFEYDLGITKVQDSIDVAKTLVGRLEELRNSESRPLPSASLTQEQRTRLSLLMRPSRQVEIEDLPSLDALPQLEPESGE